MSAGLHSWAVIDWLDGRLLTSLAVFSTEQRNLATLAGSLLGNALGDPRRWGLDAAAAAAFCALLWPRLRGRDPIATAVLAIFIALLSAPFVPAGVPVILSAVAALVVALGGTQRPDRPDRPTSDGHGHLVGEGPLP